MDISSALARRKEVSLDGTEGDSMCGDVESVVDDVEEWILVIFQLIKLQMYLPERI